MDGNNLPGIAGRDGGPDPGINDGTMIRQKSPRPGSEHGNRSAHRVNGADANGARQFAVRFGKSASGEPILIEQERGEPVSDPTFDTGDGRKYYRRGDLIGRGKYSWDWVLRIFPDFSQIPPPIAEDPELKDLGLLTGGELPEYEIGYKIESINPVPGNPYQGTVVLHPYVMLTPEQSGETKKHYYMSDRIVVLTLDRSAGGNLNQFFVDSRMVYKQESPGGGVWFGRLAVAVTKEVLSHYGSVFVGAAKDALKHALGVGAKKMAEKYAARFIAKKGREAAVKRLVAHVFAQLAQAAILFDKAAIKAALAFIEALAKDLLYQTKKNVRLLATKGGKGSKESNVSTGPTGEVIGAEKSDVPAGFESTVVTFDEPATNTVDWHGAFEKGITAGAAAGVGVVIGDIIKKHLKFGAELDKAIAKELGDNGLHKGIEDEVKLALRSKMYQELWTDNSKEIIQMVGDLAGDKEVNADNFTKKLREKLEETLIKRLKSSFAGIPAMLTQ